MADSLMKCLVEAGYKATRIASTIRKDEKLFDILVQQKSILPNSRVDFKTLADVLIQQVVIHTVDKKFSGLGTRVFGEEDNEFKNKFGEKIIVQIQDTEEKTANLLSKVLDGNKYAAKNLARLTHEDLTDSVSNHISKEALSSLENVHISFDKTAFWVDPIDGTHHYVKDYKDDNMKNGVAEQGLKCVAVLIGSYSLQSGLPTLGVVFEPFSNKISESENLWNSVCYWSCSVPGAELNNVDDLFKKTLSERFSGGTSNKLVVMSSNDEELIHITSTCSNFSTLIAGACGYKASCVYKGLVDLYVSTSDSCYKWDTCAVQSILMSIGGGICQFASLLRQFVECGDVSNDDLLQMCHENSLKNAIPNANNLPTWANIGGIVAYSPSPQSMECLKDILLAYKEKRPNF